MKMKIIAMVSLITMLTTMASIIWLQNKKVDKLNIALGVSGGEILALKTKIDAIDVKMKQIEVVKKDLLKIEIDYKNRMSIFDKHDFNSLFQKKPSLIIKRINNETKNTFNRVSCVSGNNGLCEHSDNTSGSGTDKD